MDDVLVNHFQTPCPEEEERRRQVKLHLEGALIPSVFDKHVESLGRHPVATSQPWRNQTPRYQQ